MTSSKTSPIAIPRVVLAGRMNVGKSTLFNLLIGQTRAVVSAHPGTTRDVTSSIVHWRGLQFQLHDTGGLDVEEEDNDIREQVITHALRAITNASLVLFMVDAQQGLLPQDRTLLQRLRKIHVPIMFVVNKVDRAVDETALVHEFLKAGMHPIINVSARNGRNSGDLLDHIVTTLKHVPEITDASSAIPVAIVGRPNVGKSSLFNAIIGIPQAIVSATPHTTRDVNDMFYETSTHRFLFKDTAGLRRRNRVGDASVRAIGRIEIASVRAGLRTIHDVDVALFVVEAQQALSAQDKKIAQFLHEQGKAVIVVANKWDCVPEKSPTTIDRFTEYFRKALPMLSWAPILFVSALEEQRVRNICDVIIEVHKNWQQHISDDACRKILATLKNRLPHTTRRLRGVRPLAMRRLRQVGVKPPQFHLSSPRPKDIPSAVIHILEKCIREAHPFDGTKMIIFVK